MSIPVPVIVQVTIEAIRLQMSCVGYVRRAGWLSAPGMVARTIIGYIGAVHVGPIAKDLGSASKKRPVGKERRLR